MPPARYVCGRDLKVAISPEPSIDIHRLELRMVVALIVICLSVLVEIHRLKLGIVIVVFVKSVFLFNLRGFTTLLLEVALSTRGVHRAHIICLVVWSK